jgi:TRAP-type C4-dicarboxylate transport system permease large subunit
MSGRLIATFPHSRQSSSPPPPANINQNASIPGFAFIDSRQRADAFAGSESRMLPLNHDPVIVLFLIIAFLLLLGLFVEGIPVLIIFTPILIPVAAQLHIDPIFFGVILVMTIVIASVTPLVGVLNIMCCAIGKIGVSEVAPVLLPFYGVMVAVLFLCAYFPSIVMLIPRMMP